MVLTPVAFLVHGAAGLEDASVRYRVMQFIAPLREEGFDLQVFPIPCEPRRRLALFRTLRAYPLVGIQRKLFSLGYLYLLRRIVRRLLYDFDDALFVRDSRKASRPSWTRRSRFARTVRLADGVIAGNGVLLNAAKAHNRRVHLLPTCIDLDRYRPGPGRRAPGRTVTVGWIGSRSTLFYLEDLAPALEAVPGPDLPEVRLKIIADDFIRLQGMEVVRKAWREEEEVEDLREVDIGIMPLRDDLWSRGKCGLKLLQYMAMGIPVVCTPVGSNLDLVSDGVEGIHARNRREWVEAIRRLASNRALRKTMGARGRSRIESEFSLAAATPRLASILRSTIRVTHD